MAIIVEQEKKNTPWFAVIVIILIIVFLGGGTYYLFFKPVPGIEKVIVSPELETVSKVSKITLDVAQITDSAVYKSLVEQVNPPDLGVFGRPNPFVPF